MVIAVEVGVTAAFVCAIHPQFVFFAPVLASEHLLAVLFLGSLLIVTHQGLGLSSRFSLAGIVVWSQRIDKR